LTILADQLRRPSFPAVEIEKARAQSLAQIESARDDTGTLANIAFLRTLFPAGHPYRQPTLDEAAAALRIITRADVAAFHAAHYAPDKMVLSIVGDVKPVEVKALIQKHFGDWARNGHLPKLSIPNVPQPAPKTIIIPVPDKAQVDVIYGFPGGLKRSDPDFYRVIVLDTILGGGTGLSSRLATNVRDRQGLVYGIYADVDATLGAGAFSVQFDPPPNRGGAREGHYAARSRAGYLLYDGFVSGDALNQLGHGAAVDGRANLWSGSGLHSQAQRLLSLGDSGASQCRGQEIP